MTGVEQIRAVNRCEISLSELNIRMSDIALALGYPRGVIPEHFAGLINEILDVLPMKCDLLAGYVSAPVTKFGEDGETVIVDDVLFKTRKIVTAQLKFSEQVVLFLCTIGKQMEEWSRELQLQEDPVMSVFVDCIASVVAEGLAGLVHDRIRYTYLEQRLSVTNRFSPGYCNWNVAEQHKLFSFFANDQLGITLTESGMMTPLKSISGIIGVGNRVKYRDYLCDTCRMSNCIYRQQMMRRI